MSICMRSIGLAYIHSTTRPVISQFQSLMVRRSINFMLFGNVNRRVMRLSNWEGVGRVLAVTRSQAMQSSPVQSRTACFVTTPDGRTDERLQQQLDRVSVGFSNYFPLCYKLLEKEEEEEHDSTQLS